MHGSVVKNVSVDCVPRFYVLRYNPEEAVQDYTYINATQDSILIGGLRPDTEYYFRVMVGLDTSLHFSVWALPVHNRTLGAGGSMDIFIVL